jgi:hypothetical protein
MSDERDEFTRKLLEDGKKELAKPIVTLSDGREIHRSDISPLSAKDRHKLRMNLFYFSSAHRESLEEAEQELKYAIITAREAIRRVDWISTKNQSVAKNIAETIDFWPELTWTKKRQAAHGNMIERLDLELGKKTRLETKGRQQDGLFVEIDFALTYLADTNKYMSIPSGYSEDGIPSYRAVDKLDDYSKKNLGEVTRLLTQYFLFSPKFGNGLKAKQHLLKEDVSKTFQLDAKHFDGKDVSDVFRSSWSNIESCRASRQADRIKNLPDLSSENPIAQSKYQIEREKIENTPFTLGDIRKGVEQTIRARLRSILR